jgi:hypothetical protein
MKKTSKKLLISSLALIITLALTATSTFAWFNMNTTVNTSFDVTITADSGFQIAIVPYEFDYATGTTIPLTTDETSITYKNNITEDDFGDLFLKNYLSAATVTRDTDVTKAATGDLTFKDISGNLINQFPMSKTDGIHNVAFLKFRIYIRSTATKSIYVMNADNSYNKVSITNESAIVTGKNLPVTDYALADLILTQTSTSFVSWKAGTDIGDFVISDSNYFTGKVSFDGTNRTVDGNFNASDYTKAYRVAFEGNTTDAAAGTRVITDNGSETLTDLEATTNIAWIYYNYGLGKTFQTPITYEGNEGAGTVAQPLTVLSTTLDTDGYTYSYIDTTIWLEGFDGECFDSILGLTGKFAFQLTSTEEIA